MSKLSKILLIGIIIFSVLIVHALMSHEPYQGSIPDPVQTNFINTKAVTVHGEAGNVELSLLAEYNIQAVVKGKKKYSDYPSQISEYDYALAWGDLNKKEIAEKIRYSQSGRWYYYQYQKDCSVSGEYIASHSANVHLIHQDKDVLKKIEKVDKNDYVRLEGYLVNVNFKDHPWTSSLSRDDTGNGACEIMYVTDIEVID